MAPLPVVSSLPSLTTRPGGADLLRTIAAGTAASVGTAFLRSLVRHVAEALDAEIAFAAEVEEGSWEEARVLAAHGRGGVELAEGQRFPLANTPCELAADRDVVTIPTGTREAFPRDSFVGQHGLDGYLAIVVRGTDGGRLGYLGVMSTRPLDAGEEAVAVLRIFAASRARLVSIADEERRKIGRNLHDGAQQRMIVLGHRIELARRKLEQDPEQAAEHLRHAGEEARAAGAELRELARGLHPAGLTEYGLEPTLAALAGRSPIPVEVTALPDRRLPEPVETTIYYLVSEALSNAVKYAGASCVRVEVTQDPGRVVAEVADDGAGGADATAGSGLAGLAGRIDALGGTLDVISPVGAGTKLRARIPLAPWRTAREPFLEFGHEDDGGAGAEMIAKVLSGEKTASISLAREWELEGGTPKIGQRLPVIDHHGRRHGTVEVVRIAVMPFGEVDAGSVEEHEAGVGPEAWREAQRDYYDRCREQVATLLEEPDWRLTDDEPLVVLRFRLAD